MGTQRRKRPEWARDLVPRRQYTNRLEAGRVGDRVGLGHLGREREPPTMPVEWHTCSRNGSYVVLLIMSTSHRVWAGQGGRGVLGEVTG